MARGQIAKQEITKKILNNFEGSFLYNNEKEIRIPIMEDGELVQIKVTLTAAKVSVEPGQDNELPSMGKNENNNTSFAEGNASESVKTVVQATEEEKENIKKLLASIGL